MDSTTTRKTIALATILASSISRLARAESPESDTTAPRSSSAPSTPPEAPLASGASVRISPGMGVGGAGLTARVGGDIIIWFAEAFGAGVSGATAFTTNAAEDGRSYALVGPSLAIRPSPTENYLTLSLSAGVVSWSCSPGPCDEEGERGATGLGSIVKLGFASRSDALEVGASIAVDAMRGYLDDGEAHAGFTFNFEVGLAVVGEPPTSSRAAPAASSHRPRLPVRGRWRAPDAGLPRARW